MTPSNSLFAMFLRIFILDAPVIVQNLLFKFSHAYNVPPLGRYLVADFSTIRKHNVSYLSKIR